MGWHILVGSGSKTESNIILPKKAKENLIDYLDILNNPSYEGLAMGVESVDSFLTPLAASDMMCVIARPSNFKSGLLMHYAIKGGESAVRSNKTNMKFAPPIFITAETPIEELSIKTLSNYSNIDSRIIRGGKGQLDRQQLIDDIEGMTDAFPITYVGHSIVNPRRGLITIDYIERAVREAVDHYGHPPRVILVDYLQRISTPGISDRRLGLGEVVERLKDLHMSVGCPLIFGSQARREVDDRPLPIPETPDGKETGSIEETADVVVSTMRPIKYWDVGTEIPKTNPVRIVTDNLFFLKVLKQRNGLSNEGFWISADPRITLITDLEEASL